MADSTALPVWVDPKILGVISDVTMDGTVSGTLTLNTDDDTYEADFASSVHVQLNASILGITIDLDSTFVVARKEGGVFEVKDSAVILEYTPEDSTTAVRDTLGFSAGEGFALSASGGAARAIYSVFGHSSGRSTNCRSGLRESRGRYQTPSGRAAGTRDVG